MAKKITRVEQLRRKYPTATFIKDWNGLRAIEKESATHILTIGDCNGWLKYKGKEKYNKDKSYSIQVVKLSHYLTTHTFYGKGMFAQSTKLLQKCGFNVILDNWDGKEE